jgi:NADPH:quinone reductase-like Zn-dependent oxidoreductase
MALALIPDTMQAIVLTGHGGLDQLELHEDWPTPVPGADEVLIRVGACGLNNTDVNTRTGWYSKSNTEATSGDDLAGADDRDSTWGGESMCFPRIQGADVAGVVVATGERADHTLIGKRVLVDVWFRNWRDSTNLEPTGYLGSEYDGGFAEFTKVDRRQVHSIDCALSTTELATFATAYLTAENMLDRAHVKAGDAVLITGASGGVGSALVQLTNRRDAIPIAMCSLDKTESVMAIGPAAVLERNPTDLRSALRQATGRDTVDVVADIVGGRLWPQLIDVIARGGRYTCAGAIAGPMVEFDLRTFYLNDLTFTGTTVEPPEVIKTLLGYIERGEINPLLARSYPLSRFHEAQQTFIDKHHVGNIVVCPGS